MEGRVTGRCTVVVWPTGAPAMLTARAQGGDAHEE